MAPPKRPIEVLILDDSDDDEEPVGSGEVDEEELFQRQLAEAIALSKASSKDSRWGEHGGEGNQAASGSSDSGMSALQSENGGVNSREQMEKERLERQRQREVAGSGPSRPSVIVGPPVKRPRVATLADLDDSPSLSSSSSGTSTSTNSRVRTLSSPSSLTSSPRFSTRFWDGAIKRVSNRNVPDNDSWGFADIISKKEGLQMAVVGAFCLDVEWVASHFDAETPLLLFLPRQRGDTEEAVARISEDIKPHTYRVIPEEKPVGSWGGAMHAKLLLLYYKTFCRVVIPTANAVDYDWDTIENAFYVHDFPLLKVESISSSDPRQNATHTQFSRELLEVMHSLGITKNFVKPYRNYDFSSSQDVRLVATTQGTWRNWEQMELGGGICALATAVKSLGFASEGGRWEIEAQGSSIANYATNWLAQMLGACSGVHPRTYFNRKQPSPPHLPQTKSGVPTSLKIKMVYPSLSEVNNSWGGQGHGGTIFCPKKTWDAANFPRHLLHHGASKRNRVISHTKTIVAIHKPTSKSLASFRHEGWLYVGSHNFTPSAWGRLQNSSDGPPNLVSNNYEMGVLIPIRGTSEQAIEARASELATYKRPLVRYAQKDVPWMQDQFKDK